VTVSLNSTFKQKLYSIWLTSVYKTNILVKLQHVYVDAVISTNLPTVPFFCRGCRLTWRCLYCASVTQQLSYGFQTTRWNADSDTKTHLVESFCVRRLLRHTLLLVDSIKIHCAFSWHRPRPITLSINPLTPNDHYSGRTASLTSERCILYIYSTNIGTEYFKHAIHSPCFFSSKCSFFFIILTYLVPVLFTFYIQCVIKLKK